MHCRHQPKLLLQIIGYKGVQGLLELHMHM